MLLQVVRCWQIFLWLFTFFILSYKSALYADSRHSPLLRVGAILPFSGELAYFGQAFRRGAELALSEAPAKHIELYFEDDHSVGRKETLTALRSLAAHRDISVVVVSGMPNLVVLDPLLRSKNLIALSAWDSNRGIEKLSKNSFGFGFSNERTGESLASYAYQELGLRSVAVVSAFDEWSEIISKSFIQQFQSYGGRIALHKTVSLDDTDFRSLSTVIRNKNVDGVYFPLYRASLLSFAKQLLDAGYPGRLLSAEAITESEVQQLGKGAEGMHVTQAILNDPDFESKYKKHFAIKKLDLNLAHVALGYDVIKFLEASLEQLSLEEKVVNSDNLRGVFLSISLKGVLGVSKFTSTRSSERGQGILVVRDGALRPVLRSAH